MGKPSTALASLAVFVLAAGLILYYFLNPASTQPRNDAQPPAGPPVVSVFEAVRSDDPAAVKKALASGIDINAPEAEGPNQGLTPIHIATAAASTETIRSIINAGANLDARMPNGKTALMLAAELGRVEAVRAIAGANAALDARDNAGWTALIHAVNAGRADVVGVLIGAGASLNAPDEAGRTALYHAASIQGRTDFLTSLIAAGADPDSADASQVTPLMAAAERGDAEALLILLNAGAVSTTTSRDGRSAMDRAVARGDDQGRRCAQILEQAGR
jgi:ankyrin repeat protein